ncbi:hypothetical protein [Thermohalobacter berrensis]|uniref:hypothetical protein n=1 Tax=Thermohalobacter berrensis TaxID=99594 RepID=UPI0015FFD64D|nr:hypothetical protein [Thermohalobacter berrensis]
MKGNKISSNARKAFENFKEELAKDMDIEAIDGKEMTKKIVEKAKEKFTNLGRS